MNGAFKVSRVQTTYYWWDWLLGQPWKEARVLLSVHMMWYHSLVWGKVSTLSLPQNLRFESLFSEVVSEADFQHWARFPYLGYPHMHLRIWCGRSDSKLPFNVPLRLPRCQSMLFSPIINGKCVCDGLKECGLQMWMCERCSETLIGCAVV